MFLHCLGIYFWDADNSSNIIFVYHIENSNNAHKLAQYKAVLY